MSSVKCGTALTALLAIAASGAIAQPVKDAKNHFQVGDVKGWDVKAVDNSASDNERLVATATHSSGQARAAVIRVTYPNTPAWRKKKYYFDEVVRGLGAATDGFVLVSRKRSKIGKVPVLDVRYRRKHESAPHVAVRFVFFRTFTLIASASANRAQRRAASQLARSLLPKP